MQIQKNEKEEVKMEKVKEVDKYVPIFKVMHDFLMRMYEEVMMNSPEDSKVWCERLKGVLEGWRTMKMAGMLPEFLVSNFHKDINHIMSVVHEKVKIEKLAEHQKLFTFNMATLQNEFRSR